MAVQGSETERSDEMDDKRGNEENKNVESVFSFNIKDTGGIPNERMRPNVIPLIPTCNYIKNERHFKKYKVRGWVSSNKCLTTNAESTMRRLPEFLRPGYIREKNSLNKSAFIDKEN